MIRARIRAVSGSCVASSLIVLWLIVEEGNSSLGAGLSLMGWWPIDLADILRSLLLTAILFLGPLFERGIAEGEWRTWFRASKWSESLSGWIGWRNYVAVCILFPFLVFSSWPGSTIVFMVLYSRVDTYVLYRARSLKRPCFDLLLYHCIF